MSNNNSHSDDHSSDDHSSNIHSSSESVSNTTVHIGTVNIGRDLGSDMTFIPSYPSVQNALVPNVIYESVSHVFTGLQYALRGMGGYTLTQGFDTVHRLAEVAIAQYDVTGSVEVLFDVRTLNSKIGVLKDASNIAVTSVLPYYDNSNGTLLADSITISAAEFIAGVNAANVVSVGKYETLYSDFAAYVAAYFGLPISALAPDQGLATLFSPEYNLNPNGGVFDAAALMTLLAGAAPDGKGAYISDMTGSVTISGISGMLRTAVDANPFGNRDPVNGTTASDLTHPANYGVSDGFFADDLIFVPASGITITLNLMIDSEAFPMPLNNVGPAFSQVTGATEDLAFNSASTTTSTFTETSTATTALITRTLSAPLLIRLANLSIA